MSYSVWYNAPTMLPASGRPATSWVHYTTVCNTQSSAPEDVRDHRPKHVELIGIINKLLLMHLVGVYIIYINDAPSNKYQIDIRSWVFETRHFSHSRRTVVTMCTAYFNFNEHYIRQQILIMGFVFSQNNTEITKRIRFVIKMPCAFLEVRV